MFKTLNEYFEKNLNTRFSAADLCSELKVKFKLETQELVQKHQRSEHCENMYIK